MTGLLYNQTLTKSDSLDPIFEKTEIGGRLIKTTKNPPFIIDGPYHCRKDMGDLIKMGRHSSDICVCNLYSISLVTTTVIQRF